MLSINISELIWTIICFFALYFLLKRFLYDPLIRHMDERAARIASGEAEREAINAELSRRNAEAESLCAEAVRESEKLAADEAAFLDTERKNALKASGSELKEARARAYEAAEDAVKEREKLVDSEKDALSKALVDRLVSGGE